MAKKPGPKELVSVFTGRITEADLIKFILEEAGIACWMENQYTGTYTPFATAPAGVQAVDVVVASADAERARAEIKRSREDETAAE